LVQEISAASREQDSGTEQINRAIQQLDQVTQQNSAVSEELAATAEELAAQAQQLSNSVAFFRTGRTYADTAHTQQDLLARLQTLATNGEQIADEELLRFLAKTLKEQVPAESGPDKTNKDTEQPAMNGEENADGIALELKSGNAARDRLDNEFERY
jgi:methyl-accepting chemotaxis protein